MTARTNLAIAILVSGRASTAAPCLPAVVVDGDPSLAVPIRSALADRGLTEPEATCSAEHVRVAAAGEAISLLIVDTDGRRARRTVSDTATAAAVIESFAMTELPAPSETSVSAETNDTEQPRTLVASPLRSMQARGSLGAALEASLGSDGSAWAGIHGGGCVHLGVMCVGGELRFAHDFGHASGSQAAVTRDATELLFGVSVPIARGRWVFAPGAGVGVGWMRSSNAARGIASDMIDVDTGGLRADVHLATSLRMTRSVLLTLGASFGLAPAAHVGPFTEDGEQLPGEPRMFGRVHLGVEMAR